MQSGSRDICRDQLLSIRNPPLPQSSIFLDLEPMDFVVEPSNLNVDISTNTNIPRSVSGSTSSRVLFNTYTASQAKLYQPPDCKLLTFVDDILLYAQG